MNTTYSHIGLTSGIVEIEGVKYAEAYKTNPLDSQIVLLARNPLTDDPIKEQLVAAEDRLLTEIDKLIAAS